MQPIGNCPKTVPYLMASSSETGVLRLPVHLVLTRCSTSTKPSLNVGDKSLLAKFNRVGPLSDNTCGFDGTRFLAWEAPAHRDTLRGDFDRSMGVLGTFLDGGNSRGGQTDASYRPPWLSLNSIVSGIRQDMVRCGVV
jgi:hypothetical protein